MQNQHNNASIHRKSINQESSLPNIKLHHQVPPGQRGQHRSIHHHTDHTPT